MKGKKIAYSEGFTLVELLLAITLFTIITTAIYTTLSTGIKIHKQGINLGGRYNDMRIAMDMLGHDFRSAIGLNEVYLDKGSQKISFYVCEPMQGGGTQIYKITYNWKRVKDGYDLYRTKVTYQDSMQDTQQKGEELLSGMKEIDFKFGYSKKSVIGEDTFVWKSAWSEESMPKMVQISIEKGDSVFQENIYCPSGQLTEFKEE